MVQKSANVLPEDPAKNPEVKELTVQTDQLLAVGSNYRVANTDEYHVAGLELQRIKGAQRRLEDLRKSMTRPIDQAKKNIMDFFRGPEDKLARAENGIKRAMTAWSSEQDRLRREAQARADEAARKERERLAAQAAKAAAAGRTEKARQLEDLSSAVVPHILPKETPKVVGISTRKVWKFEITDASQLPREYTMPDEKRIGQVVRAMGKDANIPGVRVWDEDQIAAGSARG